MSSGLTHVGICQNILPFKGQIVFHYMYKAYFICSFICGWTFIEMFYFFWYCLLKSGMYFTLTVHLILFGPATFHLLSSHLWPVATILETNRATSYTAPSL